LIVRDPRERGPDEGKGIRCIIKGAKVAAQLPGQDRPLPGGLLLHIDPLMKPKAMDLRSERGKDITLAIYELKCDTLRVCCSPLGKPRPTEFASQPGSGHSLIVLKRAKP
jgi:uncharacterized protein (TIGR03067 family)